MNPVKIEMDFNVFIRMLLTRIFSQISSVICYFHLKGTGQRAYEYRLLVWKDSKTWP